MNNLLSDAGFTPTWVVVHLIVLGLPRAPPADPATAVTNGLVVAAWGVSFAALARWITAPLRADSLRDSVSFGEVVCGLTWVVALLILTVTM